MSRPTTCHQPADIDVQRICDCSEQHAGRRAASSSGDDAGHGAFGLPNLLLNVIEGEVSGFADQGDASRDGLAESGRRLGCGVSVRVVGLLGRHRDERGHVTAETLAERACSGSGLPFTPNFGHLSKGFA